MRSEEDVIETIEEHSDTVQRICIVYLKNHADAEDIFQNVFLKYATSDVVFESAEHKKAWIIRVTINKCKDLLKSFFKKKTVLVDEVIREVADIDDNSREVLEAVVSLPEKYRDVVYLHYYEGYTAPEIGGILGKNVNTVYTLINRGKTMLREKLGGDEYEW